MTFTPHEVYILQTVHDLSHSDCKNIMPIADLAARFKISERVLCSAFKQMYNKSIHQHRLSKCMANAKIMLEKGVAIKTVTIAMGYKSNGSFSKAYKKIYLVLPSIHYQAATPIDEQQ